MDCDSDSDSNKLVSTPPEVVRRAEEVSLNLLPEKSGKKYEHTYAKFMEWKRQNKILSLSENVLLVYFEDLSKKYSSSSLWTFYSMLRSTLNLHDGVDIDKYLKLRAFLKRKSDGVLKKKSKIFSTDEVNAFLKNAPDEVYLATKVALIMGLMGACRGCELGNMKVDDIRDFEGGIIVTIPTTKTKIVRTFTVTGQLFDIYKKYAKMRPPTVQSPFFFLNFQKGKCTSQKIGVNKFAKMPKSIATFLKLPNTDLYTGHCFRRTSATILIDAGGDITALKRHGGWKSTAVAEEYIDTSLTNKMDTAQKISNSVTRTSNIASQPVASSSGTSCNTNVLNANAHFETHAQTNLQPNSITFVNYGTMTISFSGSTAGPTNLSPP